jgi:methionyl-tRNA formyltransferase
MVSGRALRVVFFGTPEFAIPTLDALIDSRHSVVGAVTQPDRPQGRGHRIGVAPVKARAVARGIPLLQPDRLRNPDFLDELASWRADLGVVAAYGKILPGSLLHVPPLGMINVHASLLPAYRGAAPVHRAVMAGDTETGVTIMRVVEALDAGPVLAVARRGIGPEETSDEVERDLAMLGGRLLVSVVDALADGTVDETPQDDSRASYAPRLKKEEGLIDWTWPADRIHNLVRGLRGWPNAYTFVRRARLIVLRSSLATTGVPLSLPLTRAAPGTTVLASHGDLIVQTGSGPIRLVEIQAEGKRPMLVREYLAGHKVAAGDRFEAR